MPERLGDLVRGLIGEHPELDVISELAPLEDAPEGAVLVLIPRPAYADALNMGRPIFARRKLKVVLWCDHETTVALRDQAPDFYDWISEHDECPPGPVPHAVAGLRAAYETGAPGIVWRGSGDQEDKVRLLSAFEAAFPGETLTWIDPKRDYEELLSMVKAAEDAWIACRAEAASHVRRFRWAMADARRHGRAIVVTDKYPCPEWWPARARLAGFDDANHALREAGSRHPGAIAALTGLEPETVRLAALLLRMGTSHEDLLRRLHKSPDPGASLARTAYSMGLIRLKAIALGEAPAPAMRAHFSRSNVQKMRARYTKAANRALEEGKRLSQADVAPWSTSLFAVLIDKYATDYLVEDRLLRKRTKRLRISLAKSALRLGETDAAAAWVAEEQASPSGQHSIRDFEGIADQLTKARDPRAANIQSSIAGSYRTSTIIFVITLAFWSGSVSLFLFLLKGFANLAFVAAGSLVVAYSLAFHLVYSIKVTRIIIDMLYRALEWTGNRMTASRIERQIDTSLSDLRRGAYRDVTRSLQEIITTNKRRLTEEHPLLRRARGFLVQAFVARGDNKRADKALRRAVELEGRIVGVDRPSFIALVRLHIPVCIHTGRAADAEAFLYKLLGPHAILPGHDTPVPHARRLASSGNADVDEYLQLFLAAPKLPPLSPEERAEALRLLAEAWITQGRYDEAEDLLQRAAEHPDEKLPHDHPERWRTLTTYGRVLLFQRHPADAEPVLRRALALAEKHAGARHPDTACVLAALARVEHVLGRPDAPATAKRALALFADAQLADTEKALARSEIEPIAQPAP